MPTVQPSLITGTSSEFLGRRPLRKLLRERLVVAVIGPSGSGKTSVAMRIAQEGGVEVVRLDAQQINRALLSCVRTGSWPRAVRTAQALVLDGPTQLSQRPGAKELLERLLHSRVEEGKLTVLCQGDGSTQGILVTLPVGVVATVGLRFPASRSGRMRFARRLCDEYGLPRTYAKGVASIEPWDYAAVIGRLRDAKASQKKAAEPADDLSLTTAV